MPPSARSGRVFNEHSSLVHHGFTEASQTAEMQTGDLVIGGLGLALLGLLCLRLASRRPGRGPEMSLEELEDKVDEQQEAEWEHRRTGPRR